jgi:rubredoxin
MQWKCPACGIGIQHHEYAPRPKTACRCAVCRLDLQFDPALGRMVLAPVAEPTAFAALDLDLAEDRRRDHGRRHDQAE